MSEKPKDYDEFSKSLYGGYGRMRAAGDNYGHFLNVQADVRNILGEAIKMTHAAMNSNSWPDLVAALTDANTSEKDVLVHAARAGRAVYDFCVRACNPTVADDFDIRDTLREVNWSDVPEKGRAAFLSMLGLFVLSRVWVLCRQETGLGSPANVTIEPIAVAAGQAMRMWDQNIDPIDEAIDSLTYATRHAMACGLSRDAAVELVTKIATSKTEAPQAGPPMRRGVE